MYHGTFYIHLERNKKASFQNSIRAGTSCPHVHISKQLHLALTAQYPIIKSPTFFRSLAAQTDMCTFKDDKPIIFSKK